MQEKDNRRKMVFFVIPVKPESSDNNGFLDAGILNSF